ncbi:MAG: PhoH family protein [Blastochloris sp.]|nr:PhoH family protein [Blastochloris sp.]
MIQTAAPLKRTKTKAKPKTTVKHYVLDTNVLIHDPQSLMEFEENNVWLPAEVLEELDRFKSESTTRGANAREVHRRLSAIFKTGKDMRDGVVLPNGGRLHVAVNRAIRHENGRWFITSDSPRFQKLRNLFCDFELTDNRILATAVHVADTQTPPTILVTKDLNMQLKAKALGLEAQDYRTDYVEDSDIRRTQRKTEAEEYSSVDITAHKLQAFGSSGTLVLPEGKRLLTNQYVLLRNKDDMNHGIPARHEGDGIFVRLRHEAITIRNGRTFKAANLGQRFLLDALYDPKICLITVYGKAGTGKTLLSVGAALQQVQNGDYEKLLITRVIMPTGRDIGFLPGSKEDKMQPWVQPAYDALELLLAKPKKADQFEGKRQSGRKNDLLPRFSDNGHQNNHGGGKTLRPYEPLLADGTLEIEALAHIRGRSIPNSIFLVDEAQQLTPHEAKTIVTRMSKGSKLIMIGDLAQIDNPYVDANTNGLVYTRSKLQGQGFMAHINLFKGERSEMADIAANVM